MSTPRDIAGDFLHKVQEEFLRDFIVSQDTSADEIEETISAYKTLAQKIRYNWRPEDAHAIGQIRATAEALVTEFFAKTFSIIDELYESFRKVELNSHGQVIRDHQGRMKYQKDEFGNHVEDFSALTGQDIEKALLDLQRERFVTSQQVAELLLEANFAHFSYKDEYWEKYESVLDGTNPIREAKANRETKQSKYFSYFRYYVWYRTNEFNKELDNLVRILEKIRQWRVYEQK